MIPARFGRPEGGKGGGEGAQGRESEHLADGCSGLGTIKDAKQRGRLRTREGGERGFLRKHRSVRVLIAFFPPERPTKIHLWRNNVTSWPK